MPQFGGYRCVCAGARSNKKECRPPGFIGIEATWRLGCFLLAMSLAAGAIPDGALAANCQKGPPPTPIIDAGGTPITCHNTAHRSGPANAIGLTTSGVGSFIGLFNSGRLDAGATGISTVTSGLLAPITITNLGPIFAGATGISAVTAFSGITIHNSGDIAAAGLGTFGISAVTGTGDISLKNSGDISTLALGTFGISAISGVGKISLHNSGDIAVGGAGVFGISGVTGVGNLFLHNSGDIAATGVGVFGISALTGIGDLNLQNSGHISAVGVGVFGISAITGGSGSALHLHNSGGINSGGTGIFAQTNGSSSPLSFESTAHIKAAGVGLEAETNAVSSPISFTNSGDVQAGAQGLFVQTNGGSSDVSFANSGDVKAGSEGIFVQTNTGPSAINFANSGKVQGGHEGIFVQTNGDSSALRFANSGGAKGNLEGIFAQTNGGDSAIRFANSGHVRGVAEGIFAETNGDSSDLHFANHGNVVSQELGIFARTNGGSSAIHFANSGAIKSGGTGIFVQSNGGDAAVTLHNSGAVRTSEDGGFAIEGQTNGGDSPLNISNAGNLTTAGAGAHGIFALTSGGGSTLSIANSGAIRTLSDASFGIFADGGASIENSGSVHGGQGGILAEGTTSIENSGSISADTLLAINVTSGDANITNSGTITGYVQLDASDSFVNQANGVFEARLTSDFGPGPDLFKNEGGGTVHTADNPLIAETTNFFNLERFENSGLVSLIDGHEGDVFHIANTVGGTNLAYTGSADASLGVDAYLGGPGSRADNFIIDGTARGKTLLVVNNTSNAGGAPNSVGIPVVYVNTPVAKNAFYLDKPVDAGFYSYDLFLNRGATNVFVLKTLTGPGSFLLPELATAAQDIFFGTSDTWFDRTADLRVLLNEADAGEAVDQSRTYLGEAPHYNSTELTPAVWVRASGAWLGEGDTAHEVADGRSYQFSLNRDLTFGDGEAGVDFGKRDVLLPGDLLVFGGLGGFVAADLDYSSIARDFDFQGAEVGAYATYLNGGLFVDSLFKADLLTLKPQDVDGFPQSLDSDSYGFRVDSGYRFGGFRGGMFIEPLATIASVWTNIDNFSEGGNSVQFEEDANVRGRLGLRIGTSRVAWNDTRIEPFVIGSLWGTLAGKNTAQLTSFGTTLPTFEDDIENAWGVISAGVNLFSPSKHTSAFAKLDVSFGDDLTGVGGEAGFRVTW